MTLNVLGLGKGPIGDRPFSLLDVPLLMELFPFHSVAVLKNLMRKLSQSEIRLRNALRNTLPETNSSPLKMDGWNTTFLLGRPIFRGELLVSGRVD